MGWGVVQLIYVYKAHVECHEERPLQGWSLGGRENSRGLLSPSGQS